MTNTEAFYRFHRFNEAFDRNLKVTFGALEGLRTGIYPVTDGRTNLPIGKEPWRKLTSLTDPAAAAESAILQTATMGIVRVTAALEDFLTILIADFSRTAFTRPAVVEREAEPVPPEFDGLPIPEKALELGIDPALFSSLMPLHRYFTVARNCIVHRNGRASAELLGIAQSPELEKCHAEWPTKRGAPVPTLPIIAEGAEISWLPRHAIFCLTVYYEAAKILNAEMVKLLGPAGLVYMTAHYALLDSDPIASGARRTPEAVISTVLHNRYRHRGLNQVQIINALRAMDKWKICQAAFLARAAEAKPAPRKARPRS